MAMNPDVSSADGVFTQAIEIESPLERAAFLDAACASDPQLRRELEKLVHDHFRAGDFLERPAACIAITAAEGPTERPGTVIGPYKLLEQIGEGGMGLVFVAEQQRPVKRRVALKVIKPGMESRQVLARFEAERQALALMDHPNIAKVHDGGTTEGGRPYFVMELVKGKPITDYADTHRLTTRQRLELFLDVCHAVQHAHQKGIIHRDLKPSNVLVSLHDVRSVVKVIDFGVAKATGARLTDQSIYTGIAQMIGTPLYMSPEQAGLSDLDVDTRSDVYAVGVLLYELLTGTTPFESETLKKVGYDEMRHFIREDEPPRPSTRLSTMQQAALTTIEEKRSVEPRRLTQVLRGELDWIVMKALEKDRNRRYESASAFAADVQRYLNDEAVAACPPSASYRLRKFTRRNRRPLMTAAVIAVALVAATVVSAWQAVVARDAQHQAEADRKQAEADRKQAEADRERAQIAEAKAKTNLGRAREAEHRATTEAAIARAVSSFLQEDLLKQANSAPEGGSGSKGDPNVTVREALDRASAKVSERFRDQPLVEAAIRTAIAEAYGSLGEQRLRAKHLERAVELRQAQLGPHHEDTRHSMRLLADAYTWMGRAPDAVVILEQLLDDAKARLGPDDPELLDQMRMLAKAYRRMGEWKKAMRLLEQVIEKDTARRGPIVAGASDSAFTLGMTYQDAGLPSEAAVRLDKVRERRHQITGSAYDAYLEYARALAYQRAGRLDEADPLLRDAADHYRKRGNSTAQFDAATLLEVLSVNLLLQHRYSEAEQLAREVIALYEKNEKNLNTEMDWRLPHVKNVLGGALLGQKKYAEAEPLLQGYEGMKRGEATMVAQWRYRLTEAGERVIRYYEETNQPEKAREWRERLLEEKSKK
jgi:serine/threonine protein kinase